MGRRSDVMLTRTVIARAALDVLDEEGPEALTVRRIAARLGVKSPSLYNHVASKDEILDAVTELIAEEIDRSVLDDPDWRQGFVRYARSYRQAFRTHPTALAVIARRPVETAGALGAYDAVLAMLQRAGWSPGTALRITAALDYLVLGAALVPFTGGFVRTASEYAEDHPALAAALTAPGVEKVDDSAFELGLRLLVEGLRVDPS